VSRNAAFRLSGNHNERQIGIRSQFSEYESESCDENERRDGRAQMTMRMMRVTLSKCLIFVQESSAKYGEEIGCRGLEKLRDERSAMHSECVCPSF